MTRPSEIDPSRRRVLSGGRRRRQPRCAAPAVWTSSRAQSKRIVVRDDGGIYTKAYSAVFYKPFTQTTGIEVVGVQANAEPVAQIKTHGRHQELHLGHGQDQPAGDPAADHGRQGLSREARPRRPIRSIATIPQQYMSPYGVGTNVYTTVLAYRTDAFKGRKAPASWADLWNVKDVPGRRAHAQASVRHDRGVADGRRRADRAASIPATSTRAFAALDKIKPDVAVWWTSGAQVEQMLTSGEVDMIADLGVARAGGAGERRAGRDRLEPGHLGRATTGRSSPARRTPTPAASSSSSRPTPSGWRRWPSTSRPA